MYTIYAQLKPEKRTFSGNGAWRNERQEVDTAETKQEAEYLVGEYALAYGTDWNVWVE